MNIKRWLTAIVVVLLIIATLGFVKFNQIQAAIAFGESFPEPSASVKSDYAATIEHTQTTTVVGHLIAPNNLMISNEYAGKIIKIGFSSGEIVEQGQLLVRLDSSLEKANLNAAKARLKLAKSSYKRLIKLLNQKRVSQDEVDQATANVSISQAEVDNLTAVIDKKDIIAPFRGRVGLTQLQVGQLLDSNSEITQLIGLGEFIWVDFKVPQTLPALNIGSEVSFTLIRSDESKHVQKLATIIAKNPSVDSKSRQQSYRAQLANPDFSLSHNQMISVQIPVAKTLGVSVPSNAITRSHFGDFVYVLEKDSQDNWRAKPIKVVLGNKVDDQQIVIAGLSGGEFIATEGAFKLTENILVYTQSDHSAAAGGE